MNIKSAKKYIRMRDGWSCMTFIYKCFAVTGYGAMRVKIIHRKPKKLFERYGKNLSWRVGGIK